MKCHTASFAIVFGLMWATHAHAQTTPAISGSIKVDGLSCPFCAFGMEKNLKTLGWAESIKIHIDAGRADFDVKAGQLPDVTSLRKAVTDGGFTPREVSFTLRGKIVREGESVWLLLGSGQRVAIASNKTRSALLKEIDETSPRVQVAGVPESTGPLSRLVIDRFKLLGGA